MKYSAEVDVILATKDRNKLLRSTLESIVEQDYAAIPFRIIVVDNSLTGNAHSAVKGLDTNIPVLYLHEPTPGKNSALNTGLKEVSAPLVVFTDDDIIAEPQWLSELVGATKRWPNHDVFGGAIKPLFPPNTPDYLSKPSKWSSLWFARMEPDTEGEGLSGFGPNLAFRATVFDKLRFTETIGPNSGDYVMGSETDFQQRLLGNDGRVILVPTAVVHHVIQAGQLEHKYLLQRCYRGGRGIARVRPDLESTRLLGCPRWIWRSMLMAFFNIVKSLRAGKATLLLAGAELYYLSGMVAEYRHNRLLRTISRTT